MRRIGALISLGGGICALVGAGLFLPPRRSLHPDTMVEWPPTRGSIAAEIGSAPTGHGDARARRFETLTTRRYRDMDLAVRVLLRDDESIELRCGANISRWLMARIAVQVQSDCSALFGGRRDVDVYETYVGIQQRRIASLRQSQGHSGATVHFVTDAVGDSSY